MPAMKTKSMYLTGTSILALLLASPLTADETNMRYSKLAGSYQLEVEHMIQAGEGYAHPAERTFSMSLDMQDSEQAVTATLVEVSVVKGYQRTWVAQFCNRSDKRTPLDVIFRGA